MPPGWQADQTDDGFILRCPRRGLTVIRLETSSDPRRGVSHPDNIYEPQIPVVSDDIPCPAARDVIVSRVGAVRPLETVTPRSGAVLKNARLSCSDSEASDDDVLSVGTVRPLETAAPLGGARVPINRPMIYYTRLNDFDWVVPHYDTDILLSGRDIEV